MCEIEHQIAKARLILCSRIALVESARVFHRLRIDGTFEETQISDPERAVDALWSRSEIWELTRAVCERRRRSLKRKTFERSTRCILRPFRSHVVIEGDAKAELRMFCKVGRTVRLSDVRMTDVRVGDREPDILARSGSVGR